MADVDGVDFNSDRPTNVPGWFDISTPDSERTRAFYKELLGWTVHVLDDNYALVIGANGEPTGGIGQAGPGSPYTGFVTYFPVDDVEAALDQAEKLGGTRVLEPQSIPGRGRIAVFADPDGNNVGLLSS
ncbi:VOC family protein [Micromonospora sp. NPDC049523]|uniref:VOC family protein n=1 Tax=Micromonospora sp. NPDC049523 TaxID=3155921 RepID=UPI0034196347